MVYLEVREGPGAEERGDWERTACLLMVNAIHAPNGTLFWIVSDCWGYPTHHCVPTGRVQRK